MSRGTNDQQVKSVYLLSRFEAGSEPCHKSIGESRLKRNALTPQSLADSTAREDLHGGSGEVHLLTCRSPSLVLLNTNRAMPGTTGKIWGQSGNMPRSSSFLLEHKAGVPLCRPTWSKLLGIASHCYRFECVAQHREWYLKTEG